jgi:hypothetical protein
MRAYPDQALMARKPMAPVERARQSWLGILLCGCVAMAAAGCGDALEGVFLAQAADTVVVMDFAHRPLPNIPLPNDVATRYHSKSATGRRINASMLAPTAFERRTREMVDTLDGWGAFSAITIPFSAPLDVQSIVDAHHGDDYDTRDDVIYVVDVTVGSPTFGQPALLDIGQGNFPVALEKLDSFWQADPRGDTNTLLFEEHDEDLNGNGVLDDGEDSDLDGVLDVPNYLPGVDADKGKLNLAQRADAMMTFYERETHTVIARPLRPLRERTTYAVVVTRRLKDAAGAPVGSPYAFAHHLSQTAALQPLVGLLDGSSEALGGLRGDDVAFAFSFTVGTMTGDLVAVRDGLYGYGVQKHLGAAFPPELEVLHRVWDKAPGKKWETPYTLSSESFKDLNALLDLVKTTGDEGARNLQSAGYVDFHALGSFQSPQLFGRHGADGSTLDYNEMVWPPDVYRVPAPAEGERVGFWLTVPRKEVSARKDGKRTPVVIIGHGYTSSKFEVLAYHAILARHGLAAISIDCAGHGLVLPTDYQTLAPTILKSMGMEAIGEAVLKNRAWDQDDDGLADSGADFWTAYTFHTRDNVRQSAIDYVQLIRVMRTWDGTTKWKADTNGNGLPDDLAGDFDGDGVVDVGGPGVSITMAGASLGGIMAGVLGGLEPELDAVVPIAGGAGLGDVGIRSIQGGVREAVQLRMMGPLYIGLPFGSHGSDNGDKTGVAGEIVVRTVVPRLNGVAELEVARLAPAVAAAFAGGSVRAENLDNGEVDCARVGADGSFRVALASDVVAVPGLPIDLDKPDDKLKPDARAEKAAIVAAAALRKPLRQRHTLTFYAGLTFQTGVVDPANRKACVLRPDAVALHTLDKFGKKVRFHYRAAPQVFEVGDALAPIAEGLGLHRARPEMRRFMNFAQLVLDPGDPAIWAQHYQSGEIRYGDGAVVQTNALVWHNVGDMNVPVSTGVGIARAAGLLDLTTPIAAWGGRTVNQALIDGHVLEAVDKIPRYLDGNGVSVPLDPEDLSASATPSAAPYAGFTQAAGAAPYHVGHDGYALPRLSPPLRTYAVTKRGDGYSGIFVPLVDPDGEHDPPAPGRESDRLRKQCKQVATSGGSDAGLCDKVEFFDSGSVVYEMLAVYTASGGRTFTVAPCQSTWTCSDVPPPPPARK